MNYLAHLFLSGNNDDILVGNYITDGIKGEKLNHKPKVRSGITLHRKIDDYTDSHAIVTESVELLKPNYGLYAWVIVDVFYDHFLAKNWKKYATVELPKFAQTTYTLLDARIDELPKRSKLFLGYMKMYDILVRYGDVEGIQKVLKGLSNRSRHDSKMELATKELEKYYDDFDNHFNAFFPQIIAHVKQQEEVEKIWQNP